MKRLVPLMLALFVFPPFALAAATGSHDETKRLTGTDMTLAKRAAVHRSELATGWRLLHSGRPADSDFSCSFDPDLSAFVITGEHETVFEHRASGARIVSGVGVFRNVKDAANDFKASAKPGFLRCLRRAMLQGFRQAHLRGTITWSRMSTTPRLGAQSVSYHLVATVSATSGGPRVKVYEDFHAFRQGRSQAVVAFMAPLGPVQGQAGLVHLVERRLR